MRVTLFATLGRAIGWLVQQTEESSNVERKRFAKELAKVEAKLRKAELERANAW